MNEEKSDVVFVVEKQTIPALKAFLSVKSRVFSAMFSGDFKESKDKKIVIEDTTYEAFHTFIRFLYCDDLELKDDDDFKLIGELYKLSDRYDVSRLEHRLTDILYEKCFGSVKTKKDFQIVWLKMRWILKFAFDFKIEKLMDKVMEFVEKNLNYFLIGGNEVLMDLNNWTDGRLLTLMVDKSHENRNKLKDKLKNQIKELLLLMTKKCQQLNEINKSQKDVKRFKGD